MPTTVPEQTELVHVAVAVIERRSPRGVEILLSKRPKHVHQGGLWEFPGGKVEQGESVLAALDRELHEELDLSLPEQGEQPAPLISIYHDYGDKQVLLDVWRVPHTRGDARGKEGQPIRWVPLAQLDRYEFPVANRPIVMACQLPSRYAFTHACDSLDGILRQVEGLRDNGLDLIRLRLPQLHNNTYSDWVMAIAEQFGDSQHWLVADRPVDKGLHVYLRAIHLGQRQIAANVGRDRYALTGELPLALSCHNEAELKQAHRLSADFITLSPVLDTPSHPGAEILGWQRFKSLVATCTMPVYALGGMQAEHEAGAVARGAQGIAAISAWQSGEYYGKCL